MGGTFDPVHLGHLRAAEAAREALRLEKVLFVPAGTPPHRSQPLASARDRWTMVCLATAGHPAFEPCDFEIERPGPSYTVDTVTALRAAHPGAEVFLVVGSDTCPEIDSWRDRERLVSLCRVAVIERPAEDGRARPVQELPAWAEPVAGAGLPISATQIRRLAAEGRSIRYLVPESVADYVIRRGLYR
jgi:nicotinate-nucleotide adenylyltransferase